MLSAAISVSVLSARGSRPLLVSGSAWKISSKKSFAPGSHQPSATDAVTLDSSQLSAGLSPFRWYQCAIRHVSSAFYLLLGAGGFRFSNTAEAASADTTKPYLLVSRNFGSPRFVKY